MRTDSMPTMLITMDTLLLFALLAVALAPLGIVVRELLTRDHLKNRTALAAFYDDTSSFPSLETMQELERTGPTHLERREWWKD